MKTLSVLLALVMFPALSQAAQVVVSSDADAQVNIARVQKVLDLKDQEVAVNIAVKDLGGSTDVSPTYEVYLTLYLKGEMFSTDATFRIGSLLSFQSARLVSPGLYLVSGYDLTDEGEIKLKTFVIDAKKALKEIKEVNCDDGGFDCDASTNFKTSILVNSTY